MNAPKLRLQGFTGEWESRQIGEISTFAKGSGYSKSDLCMTGVPIILYGRMYTKYSFEMDNIDTFAIHKDGAVYSKGTEVVIPASGETAEDIAVAASIKQEGVILGGDLNILTFEDSFLPSFMALCISHGKTHFELSRYAQGKSVVHLRNNDIAKAQITTPCIYEQQKIVDYFKNLESLIDATAKKIESLKQVKAACLQSMFPQPGEGKPRLRFKEYDDNWDVLPLSTFARKSTEKNTALEYNITLTNSAEYGVINQLDFFDHDISNDNHIDRYYVIHNDDFVYNPRVSTFAPVGPINRNTLGYSGVMSPL